MLCKQAENTCAVCRIGWNTTADLFGRLRDARPRFSCSLEPAARKTQPVLITEYYMKSSFGEAQRLRFGSEGPAEVTQSRSVWREFCPFVCAQRYICNSGRCRFLRGSGETALFGDTKGGIVRLNLRMGLSSMWIWTPDRCFCICMMSM